MDIMAINTKNIKQEHICCAISDKKGENCISLKKAWLCERFKEGLVFKRLNARGKVFIEYIPAENAWAPINAKDYMYINCLWVSGQFKDKGYAHSLLQECIKDTKAQKLKGLVALGSKKKKHFLTDPKFLKYKGFQIADTCFDDYELLYLPFSKNTPKPQFSSGCTGRIKDKNIVLYYTNQCPFSEKYAYIFKNLADETSLKCKLIKIENKKQAQAAPMPFTTYSIFINGTFITNEILSEKKIIKLFSNL